MKQQKPQRNKAELKDNCNSFKHNCSVEDTLKNAQLLNELSQC